MPPKFKIQDIVQTNTHYSQGFENSRIVGQDSDVQSPSGSTWLKNLKIIEVIRTHKNLKEAQEISNNKNTSNYIYICKSKTKEYILNQCFLEKSVIISSTRNCPKIPEN